MTIGIDIDNVLNNLCEAVLEVYNQDSGDNLLPQEITEYYIDNFVKPEFKENFKSYFLSRKVWKNIKLIPDCREYIKKLFDDGHEIIFITSTEYANAAKKASWLQKNFPFLNIRKCLFIAPKKQYFDIDFLIDDYPENLYNGKYEKILLNCPWNQKWESDEHYYRCSNWETIYILIKELSE